MSVIFFLISTWLSIAWKLYREIFGPPLSNFLFILSSGASARGIKKITPHTPKKTKKNALFHVLRGVGISFFKREKDSDGEGGKTIIPDLQPMKREKAIKMRGERIFFMITIYTYTYIYISLNLTRKYKKNKKVIKKIHKERFYLHRLYTYHYISCIIYKYFSILYISRDRMKTYKLTEDTKQSGIFILSQNI